MTVIRIVSGGQSGVDRAALDAARAAGVETGGWCPAGRWAEDGPIDPAYLLRETAEADPSVRTRLNIRDSDATLILAPGGRVDGIPDGTALTAEQAPRLGRPFLTLDPSPENVDDALAWLAAHGVRVLNVGGPRESSVPGIYGRAHAFMVALLARAARSVPDGSP